MKTHIHKIQLKTKGFFDIVDITDEVEKFLKTISANNGIVNVYTRHTTVALKINEKEKGFFEDLKRVVFKDIADPKNHYKHNDTHSRAPETMCSVRAEECLNGHSHVAQMLLGSASETVPIKNSEMLIGTWQRVLMIELDKSKNREVIISFVGETK